MHLQQTKRLSRATGGAQYYFHELTAPIKNYLRWVGAVQVALVTPYGATKSDFIAVSTDCKLNDKLRPIPGKVGHDRIQQGKYSASIGEAIRHWYHLPKGDFERIDVDIDIVEDIFYITPLSYRYAGSKRTYSLKRIDKPLTFTSDYVSPFWKIQIAKIAKEDIETVKWSLDEICRVVSVHRKETKLAHIQETDLLRASGALNRLGVVLGGYVGKGYDCVTEFQFLGFPAYVAPIEIKKFSRDFQYQQQKYGKDLLSRAVVLCAFHDHTQVPKNIDIIELDAFCAYGKRL